MLEFSPQELMLVGLAMGQLRVVPGRLVMGVYTKAVQQQLRRVQLRGKNMSAEAAGGDVRQASAVDLRGNVAGAKAAAGEDVQGALAVDIRGNAAGAAAAAAGGDLWGALAVDLRGNAAGAAVAARGDVGGASAVDLEGNIAEAAAAGVGLGVEEQISAAAVAKEATVGPPGTAAAAEGVLSPQGLACVLWSLVQLRSSRLVPLSEEMRREAVEAVLQLREGFNSQGLAMAVWALARLKVRGGEGIGCIQKWR